MGIKVVPFIRYPNQRLHMPATQDGNREMVNAARHFLGSAWSPFAHLFPFQAQTTVSTQRLLLPTCTLILKSVVIVRSTPGLRHRTWEPQEHRKLARSGFARMSAAIRLKCDSLRTASHFKARCSDLDTVFNCPVLTFDSLRSPVLRE